MVGVLVDDCLSYVVKLCFGVVWVHNVVVLWGRGWGGVGAGLSEIAIRGYILD